MKLISLLTSFRQSVLSQWMVQDIRLIDTITPKPNHNSLLLSTIRLGRGFYGSHLVHTYTVAYRTYFYIQSLTRWVTGSLEIALVSTKVILTIRRLEFSARRSMLVTSTIKCPSIFSSQQKLDQNGPIKSLLPRDVAPPPIFRAKGVLANQSTSFKRLLIPIGQQSFHIRMMVHLSISCRCKRCYT